MQYTRTNLAMLFAMSVAAIAGCGKASEEPPTPDRVERYKDCLKDLPKDDISREHCFKLAGG